MYGGQIHRSFLSMVQGFVYRPMGMRDPVVSRGLGREEGNPRLVEVWKGGMGSFGLPQGYKAPGSFSSPPPYAPCDPNPLPPYDTLFLPPYSVRDPDTSACEAPCIFPHHHDSLLPLLTS